MKSTLVFSSLFLLSLGTILPACTKVTPEILSSFNSDSFLSFSETQVVSDIASVTLNGSCKKEVSKIEIQDNSNQWVEASTLAESGSDLNCEDGVFKLILSSSNPNLSSGLLSATEFQIQLRSWVRTFEGSSRRVYFTKRSVLKSTNQISAGEIRGATGDGFKASVSIKDSGRGTTSGGHKTHLSTNH